MGGLTVRGRGLVVGERCWRLSKQDDSLYVGRRGVIWRTGQAPVMAHELSDGRPLSPSQTLIAWV